MEVCNRAAIKAEPVVSHRGLFFRIGFYVYACLHIRPLLPFYQLNWRGGGNFCHSKGKCHIHSLVGIPGRKFKIIISRIYVIPVLVNRPEAAGVVVPVQVGCLPSPWKFRTLRHNCGNGNPVNGAFFLYERLGKVQVIDELMFIPYISCSVRMGYGCYKIF